MSVSTLQPVDPQHAERPDLMLAADATSGLARCGLPVVCRGIIQQVFRVDPTGLLWLHDQDGELTLEGAAFCAWPLELAAIRDRTTRWMGEVLRYPNGMPQAPELHPLSLEAGWSFGVGKDPSDWRHQVFLPVRPSGGVFKWVTGKTAPWTVVPELATIRARDGVRLSDGSLEAYATAVMFCANSLGKKQGGEA